MKANKRKEEEEKKRSKPRLRGSRNFNLRKSLVKDKKKSMRVQRLTKQPEDVQDSKEGEKNANCKSQSNFLIKSVNNNLSGNNNLKIGNNSASLNIIKQPNSRTSVRFRNSQIFTNFGLNLHPRRNTSRIR